MKKLMTGCLALLLTLAPTAPAQEQEKKFDPGKAMAANVDYRHVHEKVAMLLIDGKYAEAEAWAKQFVEANPTDGEGLFFLAAAQANLGKLDEAMKTVERAVKAGVPPERFVAGPRGPLNALASSRQFPNWYARVSGSALVHGPMVGDVTDQAAKIWVRTSGGLPVKVTVEAVDGGEAITPAPVVGRGEDDFAVVIEVPGLKADTAYRYSVAVGEVSASQRSGTFRTRPAKGAPAKFRVGFGGGAAYKPANEYLWTTLHAQKLDAFLFLGDNVYIDAPTVPAYQHYKYYRRQSRPEYRKFVADTPIYAIYDDHDFGKDDCSGGPLVDVPAWKRPVWEVFRQNWANPYYGGGDKLPGCWFDFSVGDVDFILLDGRTYRTDPKSTPPEKRTMLGPVQKQWLLDKLKNSKGTIKVLASPVPWAKGVKPGSLDTWDGFDRERQEIFSFIRENQIKGVILLSADRHRHDIWKIENGDSYPLYEFESSKLTNQHTHPMMKDAIFSWNGLGFGVFDFDTTKEDPEIAYRIVDIDGKTIHSFKLKLSDLGVAGRAVGD